MITELKQQLNAYNNELRRNYRYFHKHPESNVQYATRKIKIRLKMIELEKQIKASAPEIKESKPKQRKRKI
jgi:hypothetical protein